VSDGNDNEQHFNGKDSLSNNYDCRFFKHFIDHHCSEHISYHVLLNHNAEDNEPKKVRVGEGIVLLGHLVLEFLEHDQHVDDCKGAEQLNNVERPGLKLGSENFISCSSMMPRGGDLVSLHNNHINSREEDLGAE